MAFFVAQRSSDDKYLSVNLETQQIEYSDTEQDADWDEAERIVNDYVELLNLQSVVKVKPGTGFNHPPKPPISAM